MPSESSSRDDDVDQPNARFEARRAPLRVLITCSWPAGGRAAGFAWLRAELTRVVLAPEIRLIALTELQPFGRGTLDAALLIELDLAERGDAERLVESGALTALLSEMRSLRLAPTVALAPAPVGIILPTDRA